jgi:hypothetical protein
MDNVYLQYVLQRMMVRATMEIEKMLNPISELPQDDPVRLTQECAASAILFWQQSECAKLFMNALWHVRKELGMDLEACGPDSKERPAESMVPS